VRQPNRPKTTLHATVLPKRDANPRREKLLLLFANMTSEGLGVLGFGGYLPPTRLARREISDAHAWLNPSLAKMAKGTRTVAGWDEDTLTMAVEASRDALTAADRERVGALLLATTTPPFMDRLNSGIVTAALGLGEHVSAQDVTGSLRAGTTALRQGLDVAVARGTTALCVASDRRSAPGATVQEMSIGHGASAVLIGHGPVVARVLGATSMTVDFVDHYRSAGERFDYQWEERWARDEGYARLVPKVIAELLSQAGVDPSNIDHLCLPSPQPRLDRVVARAAHLPEHVVGDTLSDRAGDTGAAHALAILVHTLERATAGELLLVVGFGGGCDALLFEVTSEINAYRQLGTGFSKWLDAPGVEYSYARYAALNGLLAVDQGIRSEADKGTAMTVLYRHRDLLFGLVGGRCDACGTHQIPRARFCVNPDCAALDSQVPHSFADSVGHVMSWSADTLTFSLDPPAYYGLIDFEEGGRLLMDFTNIGPGGIEVGEAMRMVFRVKDIDSVRGFARYFWKATPTISSGH
jgi:hydroxymethylglutaryl-CoA synthase